MRSNLTIDHVRPTSKGGDWSWENLVTACVKCNGKKGDSTLKQLGWKLKKQPQVQAARAGIAVPPVARSGSSDGVTITAQLMRTLKLTLTNITGWRRSSRANTMWWGSQCKGML